MEIHEERGRGRITEGSEEVVPELSEIRSRPTLLAEAMSEPRLNKKMSGASAGGLERSREQTKTDRNSDQIMKKCKDEIDRISHHCLELEQ